MIGFYTILQHDTVYLHVLRSWRDGQLNLAHGTETQNKEKLNWVAQKKWSGL